LAREDVSFLTWDHPMVTGAMDLLLGSETGNCAFGVLPTSTERTLLLELLFVLEPFAEQRLHVDRFLPATPIRLVISHKSEDVTGSLPAEDFQGKLEKGLAYKLIDHPDIARKTLPAMFEKGARLAELEADAIRKAALADVQNLLGHEVRRLETLVRINNHIRPQEIQMARQEQEQVTDAVVRSRIRLDSLRLIWKGPPEALHGANRK
jgi:ATP-dependent helicase HepA